MLMNTYLLQSNLIVTQALYFYFLSVATKSSKKGIAPFRSRLAGSFTQPRQVVLRPQINLFKMIVICNDLNSALMSKTRG